MTVPAGPRPAHPLHRRTLPNGLRVVLLPGWPTPRSAVSVHYGTGFRAESPGSEGIAHLVEHLLFRGSESLPGGRFYDDLHPLGGTANGTTHADYTDYFQVVPAAALEQALFREADRMRAPQFTDAELASQLVEVGREIESMRDSRLYGKLPWPGLPEVMFRSFANAHDGYGDIGRLRTLTVDDCAAFFDAHYVPANAVLTIVTPHQPAAVWPLVERHFASVPARPADPPPWIAEPAPHHDREVRQRVADAERTALALGYRLPDPLRELPDYVACMVLGWMTNRWRHPRSGVRASAGCGFFGPLDALAPDVFVVTAVLPDDVTPDGFVGDLAAEWARLGDPARARPGVRRAVAELAGQHRRRHARLEERCRTLGRFELLFGRAELVDDLPGLITDTPAERVSRAAAALAAAPSAVLVAGPHGEDHTTRRPDPAADGTSDRRPGRARRTAAELGSSAVGPRPMPALGEPVAPALTGAREINLANGLRVVAVPDRRAELVELRLRLPLGPDGWRDPSRVAELLRVLGAHTDAARRVAGIGGELQLAQDGQWADLSAWAPVAVLPALLGVVADVLAPGPLPEWRPLPPARPTPIAPQQRMDEALRRHWAGRTGRPPADPTELRLRVLRPQHATLVLVGAADAEVLLATAADALTGWSAGPGAQPVTSDDPGPQVLLLREAAGDTVHLTLSGREPEVGSTEPARYLTTALLGGHTTARLAERCRRLGHADVMLARRDVLAGYRRASVRLAVPRDRIGEAVAGVRAEIAALIAEPPSEDELAVVRRYCSAQLLSAFDSPAGLADALRHTTAAGRGLDWVVRRPELLRTPRPTDLSAAAHDLFGALSHTVVLGDPPADFSTDRLAVMESRA
ncbi:insulinase family protein [Micromonospora sp. NPDC049645]|uniref:M16 family metallopeptidase n=1 Tax=Micromonospora sp. NPDC049645 TaxID=3155508 RepID=UPI00343757B9